MRQYVFEKCEITPVYETLYYGYGYFEDFCSADNVEAVERSFQNCLTIVSSCNV